jgi:hypothetical protein
MKSVGSRMIVAAAAAGMMLAASPAFAWVCAAKNARGAVYTSIGVFPGGTCTRALAKCRADSVAPGTCKVIASHP